MKKLIEIAFVSLIVSVIIFALYVFMWAVSGQAPMWDIWGAYKWFYFGTLIILLVNEEVWKLD